MIRNLLANLPPVVKNLLIINALGFLLNVVLEGQEIRVNSLLGLYPFESEGFKPYQLITHMFMHGGLTHIFFNMFALVMFGQVLERVWGAKRFFIFYFSCGFGAALLQLLTKSYEISQLSSLVSFEQWQLIQEKGWNAIQSGQNFVDPSLGKLNLELNISMVGASGAIFGLLMAFAMLFPNTELMLIFPPIPVKAKYFVPILMVIELFLGVRQFEIDNIAHFAHIGGALVGFILLKVWKTNRNNFY